MAATIYQQTFTEYFFLASRFSINGLSPKSNALETTYVDRPLAMAPGLIDPSQPATAPVPQKGLVGPKEAFTGGPKVYSKDAEEKGTAKHPPASHPNYLPVWDEEIKYVGTCHGEPLGVNMRRRYPPLEPFTHYEHGKTADPTFPDLFHGASSIDDITPNIGAEIHGVQISSLNDAGKDQLALFTAHKKVVGKPVGLVYLVLASI